MEDNNITRSHIAMEAMKALIPFYLKEDLSLVDRIKKLIGLPVKPQYYDEKHLAAEAYAIADAMIEAKTAPKDEEAEE